MTPRRVAVLVGSLRRDSLSRKVARALMALAPATLVLELIDIAALGFYNEDEEDSPPAAWTAFRERLRPFEAVLFVTPEYNRGLPAVLKNAVDVGSRPREHSVWGGKPGAVVSISPGPLGGFSANQHLRQSLSVLNVPLMPQPELYLGQAAALFDAEGRLASESVRLLFTQFLTRFAAWTDANRPR